MARRRSNEYRAPTTVTGRLEDNLAALEAYVSGAKTALDKLGTELENIRDWLKIMRSNIGSSKARRSAGQKARHARTR